MLSSRFNDFIRSGVLYRFDGFDNAVISGAQIYFVVRASATKNLIVERAVVESTEGEYEIGLYANEPFTDGTPVVLNVNADSTVVGQLTGDVVINPTITAAPLDLNNADTGTFLITSGQRIDNESPLIIPKGEHIVVMIDNENNASVTAKMLLKLWLREEGR